MGNSAIRFGPRLLGLGVARDAAAKHGGHCLSQHYVNVLSPLRWQCARGHEWQAPLSRIKDHGSWCPHCARATTRLDIDVAVAIAADRGGVCLSRHYVNCRVPLHWQCAEGHTWDATLHHVKSRGTWCPVCAQSRRQLGIQVAHDIARQRGGSCLSSHYKNIHSRLHWQCSKGHQWHASLCGVRNHGSWCPVCAGTSRLSIDVAANVASARGGLCLSQQYKNTNTKLLWQCAEGHQWRAQLNNVKDGGTWCPYCCARRRAEGEVRKIFETIFIGHRFRTCRPEFLKQGRGSRLELDGYCAPLRLAFEYNGAQHYMASHYFNNLRRGSFQAQVARDQLKISLCKAANVRLVIVPFSVKDHWGFIRLCLLQWFSISAVFAIALPE